MGEMPKSPKKLRLGELIDLKYGKGLPERDRIPGSYPVYGSGGIVGTHNEALIKGPGIIVGRKGSIGSIYFESKDFYPIDTVFYVKPYSKNIDLYYLSKLLTQIGFQDMNSDAAVPGLKREIALSQVVYVHDYNAQRKIAAILSAYDDLIGNNLRRIKILEDMAQNLYREWFVNFRFPSHENTRFVDSPLGRIPEGWAVVPMKSVANVVDCLHSKKPDADDEGSGILIQLFNIENGGKLNFSKKYLISEDDYVKWTNRIELSEGDCIITNVGRIAAVAQMPKGKKAALGRNMTGLSPINGKITPTYLIEYLLSPHMASEVRKKSDSGVIMDSLNVRSIYLLSVPIPESSLMDDFEYLARPIRQSIENLVEKNYFLRQTRDLLLPNLISGEVDVSELDINVLEEVSA